MHQHKLGFCVGPKMPHLSPHSHGFVTLIFQKKTFLSQKFQQILNSMNESESLLYVTDFVSDSKRVTFYGDLVDKHGNTLQEDVSFFDNRWDRFYAALREIGVTDPRNSEEIILGHVIVWDEYLQNDYIRKIISGKFVRDHRGLRRSESLKIILKNYETSCFARIKQKNEL